MNEARPIAKRETSETVAPEKVEARVEAYLRTCRIGEEEWRKQAAREITRSVLNVDSRASRANPMEAAFQEADRLLAEGFAQGAQNNLAKRDESTPRDGSSTFTLSPERRLALLFGADPAKPIPFTNRGELIEIMRRGEISFGRATRCGRSPEMRQLTMQTSLSRLPSIGLIGGWIVLIALLFFLFVITHRSLS